MRTQIVYIGANDDHQWLKILRTATISVNCSLEVMGSDQFRSLPFGPEIKLILMDAGQVPELYSTISDIHSQHTELPIVVLSAAPRWREAKDTILAGAVDYQLKPSKASEILRLLERRLKHIPSGEYEQDEKHHSVSRQ